MKAFLIIITVVSMCGCRIMDSDEVREIGGKQCIIHREYDLTNGRWMMQMVCDGKSSEETK